MQKKLARLRQIAGEVFELQRIAAVLDWDQQVEMPQKAAANRARQVSLLTALAHEKFTGAELGELLDALLPESRGLDPESDDYCLLRKVERDYRRETKVPVAHVAEFSHLTSLAHSSWEQARAKADFRIFSPLLKKIFAMRREYAGFFAPFDHIYDPLLDEFEPGMKTAELLAVFAAIRPAQVELLRRIAACPEPDQSCLRHEFAPDKQWQLSRETAAAMGYDFTRGRIDAAMHPFTTTFNLNDVRITSAVDSHDLNSLSSTMHEAGHAIYEQNISPALENTPLATGVSLGIHESQSRLWENLVGRSQAFLTYFYPRLQRFFPEFTGVSADEFYRAYNAVRPGLIRVNADEAAYNLHVMLRFELETAMLQGELEVADLPEAWNAKMKAYLGLTPPDDAAGCLQDVHWSAGLIGYFPTYALGNLIAAQLWEACGKALGDGVLEASVAAGDFGKLRCWLNANIHCHGAKFDTLELLQRICGSGLEPEVYIRYLQEKYSALYNFQI
ncbi:MAG: carboxypeptidase M32 [Victivallales bacterium]|nr:carboxypeptidase M32 [Victivallales bacterium]